MMEWIKTTDELPPKDRQILGLTAQGVYSGGNVVPMKFIRKAGETFDYGIVKLKEDHWLIDGMPWPISNNNLIRMIDSWCEIPDQPERLSEKTPENQDEIL